MTSVVTVVFDVDYNFVCVCVSRKLAAQAGKAGALWLYQCLDGQKQDVVDTGLSQSFSRSKHISVIILMLCDISHTNILFM